MGVPQKLGAGAIVSTGPNRKPAGKVVRTYPGHRLPVPGAQCRRQGRATEGKGTPFRSVAPSRTPSVTVPPQRTSPRGVAALPEDP